MCEVVTAKFFNFDLADTSLLLKGAPCVCNFSLKGAGVAEQRPPVREKTHLGKRHVFLKQREGSVSSSLRLTTLQAVRRQRVSCFLDFFPAQISIAHV